MGRATCVDVDRACLKSVVWDSAETERKRDVACESDHGPIVRGGDRVERACERERETRERETREREGWMTRARCVARCTLSVQCAMRAPAEASARTVPCGRRAAHRTATTDATRRHAHAVQSHFLETDPFSSRLMNMETRPQAQRISERIDETGERQHRRTKCV